MIAEKESQRTFRTMPIAPNPSHTDTWTLGDPTTTSLTYFVSATILLGCRLALQSSKQKYSSTSTREQALLKPFKAKDMLQRQRLIAPRAGIAQAYSHYKCLQGTNDMKLCIKNGRGLVSNAKYGESRPIGARLARNARLQSPG